MSVSEIVVCEYYLKSELSKIFRVWNCNNRFIRSFNKRIHVFCKQEPKEAKRLVRALTSKEYRGNPLHHYGLGMNFGVWVEQTINCSSLYLPAINKKTNPYLKKYNFKLTDFITFLKKDKIADLCEFHDMDRKIIHDKIIVRKQNSRMQILDGAHRAVILTQRGKKKLKCYVLKSYKLTPRLVLYRLQLSLMWMVRWIM